MLIPQKSNLYAYCANDPINHTDPNGLFLGAVLGFVGRFFAGLFGGPGGGINVFGAFTYRNLPPVSVSFTNSFNNIYVGFAGVNFQVRGQRPEKSLPSPTPCEQKLGAMFGGQDAIMRMTYDVDGQYRGRDDLAALSGVARHDRSTLDYDSIWDSEHLNNSPHLIGNLSGTALTDIYVPRNYRGRPTSPSPTAGVVLINYAQFGILTNVTLAIFHVGNFGVRRDGDRVRIGSIGGRGGGQGGTRNLHAHFEIWRGTHTSVLGTAQRYAARIPFDLAGLCP